MKHLLPYFAIIAMLFAASCGKDDTGTIYKDDQIIYYTTIDNEPLIPYQSTVFGAKIVSNIYESSKGKMIFDGPVTTIGNSAFQDCSTLTSITLPDGVRSIGVKAFSGCIYNHRTTKTNQKYPSVNL